MQKICLFLFFLSYSLFAGMEYTARMESHPEGEKPAVTKAKVAIEEPSYFRIDFEEVDRPSLWGPGDFLLTQDGGRTVYLVNTTDKTYMVLEMDKLLKSLQPLRETTKGMVTISIDNPKVMRKRGDNDQVILGYKTQHYIIDSAYTMTTKALFFKMQQKIHAIKDIWVTKDLSYPVMDFFQAQNFKTGFDDLDRLVAQEMKGIQGFILRSKTLQTVTYKGKTTQNTHTFEITGIKKKSFKKSYFQVPEGYQETTLVTSMGEDEEKEDKEKDEEAPKGLKGWLNKLKKRKD